ncbi:MAG: transglutaminase-like domain-containing protein [Eubacteriaceae bacterium]|nr:transglutaminase-like domain-containing protein [Eubacteriaceae bacterium]
MDILQTTAASSELGRKRLKLKNPNRLASIILFFVLAMVAINSANKIVTKYIKNRIHRSITIEAGTALSLADFTTNPDAAMLTDLRAIPVNELGKYPAIITLGGKKVVSVITVVDTTPPKAVEKQVRIASTNKAKPEDFFESIQDATKVEAAFIQEPRFGVVGRQTVALSLVDAGGNVSLFESVLEVYIDTTPPVIHGVHDLTVWLGEPVAYKFGIAVTDDSGEEIDIEVDTSLVNLKELGTYPVVYKATDTSKNTTFAHASITVAPKPFGFENLEQLNLLCDNQLAILINNSMSDVEKLEAIHTWVRESILYTGHSDKESFINEAINGFTNRNGDCFTCYSVLKAMMERAGFKTIDVERIDGRTSHYWSLVYVEDAWWHIDSTPRSRAYNGDWLCFLRTDEELEQFSMDFRGYYKMDSSLYPSTPEESRYPGEPSNLDESIN